MPHETTPRRTTAARVPIGRIAHIGLFAHATWFFAATLLSAAVAGIYLDAGRTPALFPSWLGAALALTLFYPLVLAHELAHAWVARRRGVETVAITLRGLGASSETSHPPRRPEDELAIAFAGPGLSLAVVVAGTVVHALIGHVRPWSSFTTVLALSNLAIVLISLLPVVRSDGARIVGALRWRAADPAGRYTLLRQASRAAAFAILAVALMTGAAGYPLRTAGLLLLSALFAVGAEQAQRGVQSVIDVRTVRDVMIAPVVSIPAALSLAEVEQQFLSVLPYRVFPLTRGDRVVGVLRRHDVLRQSASERGRLTAQAVMIRLHPYLTARPTDTLDEALARLNNRAGCVVVLDDGQLRGLLTPSARDGAGASPGLAPS
jgi:CBS domain-containing protein